MKKTVLGVKIDDINIDQALEIVERLLKKPGKHYIVTPNPEIVVMAQKDKELLKIFNNADLAIPDGVGLKLGGLLNRRTGDIECITPGIDLMEALIKLASENGFTIGLLGGRDRVANKTAECLLRKYPKLKITFADSGGQVDEDGREAEPRIKNKESSLILNSNPLILPQIDILFVALGPPKQEKWIAKNLSNLDVKVAMGVGGAFDFLSGRVQRAPIWIRNLRLEWLFRLILQPWRIKRQLALVKFIFYMLK